MLTLSAFDMFGKAEQELAPQGISRASAHIESRRDISQIPQEFISLRNLAKPNYDFAEVKLLIELIPLTQGDPDMDALIRMYQEPSVSRYISISDNYFHYVTETEGVIYYKIMTDGLLTGGIHSEIHGTTMYLSVCVDEKHRRLGIAERALKKIFSVAPGDVETIEADIDETNTPSNALFQKLGFQVFGQEDELITYRKLL